MREPRVRAIIEPMLAGQELGDVPNEDIQFVLDLGLCVMSAQGGWRSPIPSIEKFSLEY